MISQFEGVRNYKVIAVGIVSKSVFIGWNSKKTHPKSVTHYADGASYSSHHAEFDLIKQLSPQAIKRLKLYVFRLNKRGMFILAKPCNNCQRLLQASGVHPKRVFYTDSNGEWHCLAEK